MPENRPDHKKIIPKTEFMSITDGFGHEVIHQNSHVVTGKRIRLTFDWKAGYGSKDKFLIYILDPKEGGLWRLWGKYAGIDQAEAEYERLKGVL